MRITLRFLVFCFLIFFFLQAGCQRAYYSVWEKLGKEKRHLLRDKVSEVQTQQEKASEEFKDVLTRIKELYRFQGGDLETFYNRLRDDYDECENRAESIKKRIDQVEIIANDLFKEWEAEINQITERNLKSKSKQSLEDTEIRYAGLKKAMDKAEMSMEPVLVRLKDYVLYLKHNLNARAIGALKQEVIQIEAEIGTLISDMENSIGEAELFLRGFQ